MIAAITRTEWAIIIPCGWLAMALMAWMMFRVADKSPLEPEIEGPSFMPFPDEPGRCHHVSETDIETAPYGMDAGALRTVYIQAERILCESHSPTYTAQICRTMAKCLQQGIPLGEAARTATNFPRRGLCTCMICQGYSRL